jgi:hypothetical protein
VINEPEKPKPPFDIIKACFFLVASVFLLYSVIMLAAMAICSWHGSVGAGQCIKEGGIGEALSTLLASALAFAAGRVAPPKE